MSSKIETLNGHFVDPLDMFPDDLRIEDIAHALSMQCRFNGYTSRHYSIAEHSVYVARIVMARLSRKLWPMNDWSVLKNPLDREIVRQALLHDATEVYLADIPTPIKPHLTNYKEIENSLWATISFRFKVQEIMHPYVKEADRRMCSTEKFAFLSGVTTEGEWSDYMRQYPPYTGAWDIIDRYDVSSGLARRRFLDFYNQCKED